MSSISNKQKVKSKPIQVMIKFKDYDHDDSDDIKQFNQYEDDEERYCNDLQSKDWKPSLLTV